MFLKYTLLYFKSIILYSWRFKSCGFKSILFGFINLEYARYITIGRGVRILSGARIECIPNWMGQKFSPQISIGNNVNIGQNFFMTCASQIKIDDGVLISDGVAVIDNFHDHDNLEKGPNFASIKASQIIIERNAIIYRCATILGGVKIGEGAIVGAYSLVKEDVPAYSLVVGAPAKVVKRRHVENK
jgi:acetyltransferase-like isoleucine patch superfamily enzyme